MRENKYRLWNQEKKIMVYDDEDDSSDYWGGACSSAVQMVNHLLKTGIWLQYTDLKDRNGKEICEGDILRFDNWLVRDIVFIEGCFRLRNILYEPSYEHGEVIGNIYENPELQEG